jgi:thiol-disulfide isomerase/thioredoxin
MSSCDTNNPPEIVLIDASATSLTISWPETTKTPKKAVQYHLQYKSLSQSQSSGDHADPPFQTLSDKLTSTQAKKKNLTMEEGPYLFRVRPSSISDDDDNGNNNGWTSHPKAFQVYSSESVERYQVREAPKATRQGGKAAFLLWNAPSIEKDGDDDVKVQVKGYEVQMRMDQGGAAWTTVAACFQNTEVRKRNLVAGKSYQFRVRPVMVDNNNGNENVQDDIPFSPISQAVEVPNLSLGMTRLFSGLENNQLLVTNNNTPNPSPVDLEDALAGTKLLLLYASAHWCGPCRKFTPQLANLYQQVQKNYPPYTLEVVFLSCDHDEAGFASYFSSMPWKAVPFDEEGGVREKILSWIKVTGIPRLVVVNASTGAIIEDNAVGKPMDVSLWLKKYE